MFSKRRGGMRRSAAVAAWERRIEDEPPGLTALRERRLRGLEVRIASRRRGLAGRAFDRPALVLRGAMIVAAAVLALGFGAAMAQSGAVTNGARLASAPIDAGAWQREGVRIGGPSGWRKFCRAEPESCRLTAPRRPLAVAPLNAAERRQLERFNASVNAAFEPISDAQAHGLVDLWSLPGPATGWRADCEDYVLAKRAALLEAGWPPETVLIGIVEGFDTPYHAVLVLRTSQGELVLDNLTDAVLDWRATGLTWVARQSAAGPDVWVALR